MTTYAMSVNDLETIVCDFINDHLDYDEFPFMQYETIISMVSANYIINIKRLNPQAPEVLAPLKFKAVKSGFKFKEIDEQPIENLSYHDKIQLIKLIEQGCKDVLNFSGFMTLTIISAIQSYAEWQQSNATQAWLTPEEHANTYREILTQY